MAHAADRNLLFGLLALQNGIINQVQLVAAFQAWTLDRSRSLADHLEARRDVAADRRALSDELRSILNRALSISLQIQLQDCDIAGAEATARRIETFPRSAVDQYNAACSLSLGVWAALRKAIDRG